MLQQLANDAVPELIYPDSDGQPMADNTKQFRWIVIIKENLELLFAAVADVFVAGDLLWYPVKEDNTIRQAPDAMVVFGRPKGDRGSYRQWQENNIAPQVVFEILSPGNRLKEMTKKLQFYERYGVEEYYIYDPDRLDLHGLLRSGEHLGVIDEMKGWISPRLGVRFELQADTLEIYRPDGQKFLTFIELNELREQESQRAAEAVAQVEREQQRTAEAIAQVEREQQRYQALIERLQAKGIDPDRL
jgi:Uma2 family endonuclease